MQNQEIARLLRDTADLLEIANEDSFRVRSYRRAADAVESAGEPVAQLCQERARLLAIPGIGKTMCDNIQEIVATGGLRLRQELLERFQPGMLDLLQIQGLGPKTIALIWSAYQAGTVEEVEQLAKEQKLRLLPRMGAKAEEKILRGIQSWRTLAGRFRLDQADEVVELLRGYLEQQPGVERVTVAGSYRRGKETIGDLDFLVTGPGFPEAGSDVVAAFLHAPRHIETLAQGENKVSIRLHGGLQVDLRLVPPESYGAALQYFTGSKQHNVSLRQRAQRQGYSLNEYGLTREQDGVLTRYADEAALYGELGLAWIPPELREDQGELAAAEAGRLPRLIEAGDLRGDVHMHTVESDGRCTIEEMAEAALARGYQYIAITDHSKALAMANGLDEARALAHLKRIRETELRFREQHVHERPEAEHFRIFAGIEVDILADGQLDLADDVLAQLDVVIASVHSRFDQSSEETTERLLRVVANPNVHILGHPTGRLLLRREPYRYDLEAVLKAAAQHGVAAEINASPERLDFNDAQARRCKELGIPIVINTDAHHTRHLNLMRFGLTVARRAWLQPDDVLNTQDAATFLQRLHARR